MLLRDIFEPEHDEFRATARSYFETVCVPHADKWEERGYADREAWLEAGKLGLLGWEMPEEYGGDFIVNGTKTFISNGLLADLVVVVCRTNPDADKPHKGLSLIAVEAGMEGFAKGRKLDKIGQRSADTAELIFEDVRVPAENLIGEENRGFYHLMRNLPAERLGIAVHAAAAARRAVDLSTQYARDRKAFGQPIGTFQVNRHAIAQMETELSVMQTYIDKCIVAVNSGELTAGEAAGAKWWSTETQWRIVDRCLQLHGGYGYINEYEIARLWRDSRVQ